MESTLKQILSLIGNVDHGSGHGVNAARLRGDMLMSIKELAETALRQSGDPTAPSGSPRTAASSRSA